MKYGFVADVITDDQWVLGGNSLIKQEPLTDGDWERYLPEKELQNRGFETNSCTIYGTLNCIETLGKLHYGEEFNYSERFNAILAEVDPAVGGTPHNAAESMRKDGLIPEALLPYDDSINNVVAYFTGITPRLMSRGMKWLDKYTFSHDWVFTTNFTWKDRAKQITEALKYSPLGVSVPAWFEKDGYYYRPDGQDDTHWCMLYKEDDEFYYLFDSYAPFIKRFRKDSMFGFCKRYSLGVATKKRWICRNFGILCS
jgi:hypothetical protein